MTFPTKEERAGARGLVGSSRNVKSRVSKYGLRKANLAVARG